MSLILTRTQNIRALSNLDKWERRASQYGAYAAFLRSQQSGMGPVSDQLFQAAISSIGSTLETPVIDYDGSVTIGSTRSVTIADSENTSAMVSFSFTTYSWGFTQVPAMFQNNEIGAQQDYDAKFMHYWLKFMSAVDTACVAKLEADKTQVLNDNLGKYTFTANEVVVPNDSTKDEIIGDLEVLMQANDYYDQITVVGSPSLRSHVRNRLMERGEFNEVDKTYQWDDKVWDWSNRVTNASDTTETGFAINGNSLGVRARLEREALARTRTGVQNYQWDVIDSFPGLGLPVGTMYYESVGDQNAIAGAATADHTRGVKQHFGFSVDLCYVTAYNSDATTIPSPIIKFHRTTV